MRSTEMKKYMTAKDLAESAGVAISTVYLWINLGWVRAKKFNSAADNGKRARRKLRISKSEYNRVLRQLGCGLPLG